MSTTKLTINGIVSEAFQISKARRKDNADWPTWLHQAWQLERGETGSVYNEVYGTSKGHLVVATSIGHHSRILWNDYIIKTGEILWHCPKRLFTTLKENALSPALVEVTPVTTLYLIPHPNAKLTGYLQDIDSCMKVLQDNNYNAYGRLANAKFEIECPVHRSAELKQQINCLTGSSALMEG